jgi:photosystem II stability/assembly factor-like uncharacterized protein
MRSQKSFVVRRHLVVLGAAASMVALLLGCNESPWREQPLKTDADFRDIFFLDHQRGWIVGGGYNVEGGILGETTDGGQSWRFRTGIVPDPRSRLFGLNAIHFHDANEGVIAAGGGRLLRTVDGGEHWHSLLRGGKNLSSLFFIDRTTGWAAGEQWVFQTVDGGATWVRINAPGDGNDDFRARAIHFLDANRGWLVGHHGAIRRTQDSGMTWVRAANVPDLGSIVLWAVHFVDEESGWIVGEEGTALRTEDRGQAWRRVETGTVADLRDVRFSDAKHGWIVGFDPTTGDSVILSTLDGGETWAPQATIHGEALAALFFQPDGSGWAVGDRVRRQPQRLLRYSPQSPRVGAIVRLVIRASKAGSITSKGPTTVRRQSSRPSLKTKR